jgi:hypothetical protein
MRNGGEIAGTDGRTDGILRIIAPPPFVGCAENHLIIQTKAFCSFSFLHTVFIHK